MSIVGVVGFPILVSIGVDGYTNTVYPRMELRRNDNSLLPESPVDLVALGSDGQYTATWTPSEAGDAAGFVVAYEDVDHLIRSERFEPLPISFRVWNRDQDETAKRILALLGENSRVRVTNYGPNGDPQTAKVFIYDNAADAAADVNVSGEIDVSTIFNPTPLPDELIRTKVS